jgi:hypothetical protein
MVIGCMYCRGMYNSLSLGLHRIPFAPGRGAQLWADRHTAGDRAIRHLASDQSSG